MPSPKLPIPFYAGVADGNVSLSTKDAEKGNNVNFLFPLPGSDQSVGREMENGLEEGHGRRKVCRSCKRQ